MLPPPTIIHQIITDKWMSGATEKRKYELAKRQKVINQTDGVAALETAITRRAFQGVQVSHVKSMLPPAPSKITPYTPYEAISHWGFDCDGIPDQGVEAKPKMMRGCQSLA